MSAAMRIRIPRALPTYSGVLVLVLWLAARAAFAAEPSDLQEAVLEVTLSAKQPGEMMIVLRGPQGQLYLEENDLVRLRLHPPQTPPLVYEGRRYFDPTAIKGCTVAIDETSQRAVIGAPAAALDTTHLSAAARQSPPITPAAPGAFLNYQLSAQQVNGQNTGGAYTELGVFAAAGVVTSTAIARYGGADYGDYNDLVRLDTTYTRDFPDALETLNVGDSISDPGSWGDAMRFAGVRFSRNFSLRPDLLTTPLLTTGGTATVPSTVDVFVNNQLVTSNQLPAGPFVIDRLPTVSGTGDVSVVVRDALGREQTVTQSFYSSTTLLAQGLTQFAFDLGSVRENYALDSDQYGGTLGEYSYRRGITDTFTLEGHAEYLSGADHSVDFTDAHAAGLNGAWGIGKIGILNVTAAAGGDSNGSGWLSGAGFEHRGTNTSFVANALWASPDFAQVGQAVDAAMRMRERDLVQTGIGLGRYGSLSLAYVRETYRDSPTQQTLGLTQTINIHGIGTLNLSITRTHTAAELPTSAQDSTSAYLIFVVPLNGRRAASLTATGGSGSGAPANQVIASLTESPPAGPGTGYRVSLSTAGNYDADWRQQFHSADLELEAARNLGQDGQSATLSGAMTFIDGQLNTTRSVNGSFAMVDVAGLADVPVYVENQLTTHTDDTGRALLYNLRPYEANHISITPEDLPLDTTIGASSTIMAPPYRSGVIARFPVERVHSGTFRLVTEDGKPVPVGAVVKLKGTLFPVVLNGMVYVTGYDHGMSAEANWIGGHCSFRLEPPPPDDPLPDMGTIECRAVKGGDPAKGGDPVVPSQ
jgi:outer membrane usher protein